MKKIRALVIDDEPDGRSLLGWMLEKYCPQVTVLTTCASAQEGILAVKEWNPDLVFLDIEMPGMNGFAMLEALGTISFEVIFVTSYDQYAIKAFRYKALDYLLKPIDESELTSAVERCVQSIQKEQQARSASNATVKNQQLVLPAKDGYIFVDIASVLRCEADGNYTKVYLEDGSKHVVAKTLKEFDTHLSGLRFARVHKSHLINLTHIKKYIKGEGGIVVMNDNSEIEVSRRSKESFLSMFQLGKS
ncbi:MAG: LytTR family DNA-binding domain-containing protein [Cytophagaceae bacterium]|jgi:two-component system LytT family response regulator|nr:LytTR family DNA-binding domain-containing protein [Cytophagaceae bacterium]